jgi:hypothetical protein
MDREYDRFEILPDGSALWRHTITGQEAIKGLRELSAQTANEVRLMHLPSNTLIAAMTGSGRFSLIPVGSIELALRHGTIVRGLRCIRFVGIENARPPRLARSSSIKLSWSAHNPQIHATRKMIGALLVTLDVTERVTFTQ